MTAVDLLNELAAAGIGLAMNGDRLRVAPPPTGCPGELRARIVECKHDLIELIRIRDRLLTLAREVGIPDRIVLELAARELQATHDQLPWWPDADLQRRVLIFYLRSLAGIEPALPGSLAARRACKTETTRGIEPHH